MLFLVSGSKLQNAHVRGNNHVNYEFTAKTHCILQMTLTDWDHLIVQIKKRGGGVMLRKKAFPRLRVKVVKTLLLTNVASLCSAIGNKIVCLVWLLQTLLAMIVAIFMTPLLTPPCGIQSGSDCRWIKLRFFLQTEPVATFARICLRDTNTTKDTTKSYRWILKNSAPSRASGSTGVTTAMGETSKTWLSRSLVGLKVNTVCDLRAEPLYRLGRKPSDNTQKALR